MNARHTLLLALSLCLGACGEVSFEAITTAPPDRVADLNEEEGTITLSRGVALAIECTSSGSGHHGPCENMTRRVDDPRVALALPADVDELRDRYERGSVDTRQAAVLVVAGRAPGTTTVRVTTDRGGASFDVTVRDAP